MSFLSLPDLFIEEEGQSPLMAMNDGYLNTAEGRAEFRNLAEGWPSALGVTSADIEAIEEIPLGMENDLDRIIDADVARTFITARCRRRLRRVLRFVAKKLGKYAQAISYVCGFLLLQHDEEVTAAMALKISAQLPDYWNTTAVGFATDAYVFWEIMESRMKEVVDKLKSSAIQPETYLQSWFSALCVQIMPFESLVHYLDLFFQHGVKYLFQAALHIHDYYAGDLASAKTPPQIFAIVRLDKTVRAKKPITPELLKSAVDKWDLTADLAALTERRQATYDKHLKERMERAKKLQEDDDFDIGSDLDSDEDD